MVAVGYQIFFPGNAEEMRDTIKCQGEMTKDDEVETGE